MVWLSKWILANNPDARVLIVTDRDELDDQMEKVYKGVDENVVRTKSGADLISRLNDTQDRLIRAIERLTADIRINRTSQNYLIEHSADSSKTNTIAWLLRVSLIKGH